MADSELRAAVRAEVRSYLGDVAVRYMPVVAGVLAVALIVLLVPDTTINRGSPGLTAGSSIGAASASPSESGAPGSAVSPSALGAANLPSGSSQNPSGGTLAPGVAVSGVKCGPGVRQVTWTPYAPPCIPKWSGSNGGATAHGVTGSTITLVLRNPTDWDTAAQATGVPTFAHIASDMQTMVNFFNTQYELYGRKVVIRTFNGQGSFFAEASNQDQAGASADASMAYDLGAMVDGFPITAGTYSDAESSRGIVSFAPGNSEAAYKAHAPYMYGVPLGPVAEIQGAGVGAVACQRMAKMNAIFAGDATFRATVRKFAVLEPQQPEYTGGAAVLTQEMKNCGVSVDYYPYNADINQEAQEAAQITAEMVQAHDTTALMLTDPFMSQFMTDAAGQAQYQPEWVFTIFSQTMARQASAGEMAHSIDITPWHATTGAPTQRLCAHIYSLAAPGTTAQSGPSGLDAECALLMALFAGLQEAGPGLTPQTLSRGWFSLPDSSASSDFGRWSFGPNQWSPLASFSVLQWNAGAASTYDGGTGEWEPCGGSIDYPYQNPSLGTGQLQCFGH
ncbi:MAG TPA: hypothetical protein VNV65_07555 [Candidatus Solibacter sp.]|nr:hypothetical protein [Candidatus Solibacter sp.]